MQRLPQKSKRILKCVILQINASDNKIIMDIKTTTDFYQIVESTFQHIKQIKSSSGKEWRQQLSLCFGELNESITELSKQSPELYQYESAIPPEILIDAIKNNAANRFCLEATPYSYAHWLIQDKAVYAPVFVSWDKPIMLSYDDEHKLQAFRTINQLLFNALIQLPTNSIILHIVDTEFSSATAQLTSNLRKNIYDESVLVSMGVIQQKLVQLKEIIAERLNAYNDYAAFCNNQHKISAPYHIVVFDSYAEISKNLKKDIEILLNKGSQAGVFSIFMHDEKESFPFNQSLFYPIKPISEEYDVYSFNHPAPIINNEEFAKLCYQCINNTQDSPKLKIGLDGFVETTSSIIFPIGIDDNENYTNFTLNISDHPHAFILGQSGTGKSVLLHSVLDQIIENYRPEDIQLYLFDLKLGGVEFSLYKDVPHVESLLIDSNDAEITLNILQDLYKKMQDRGVLLREVGNIDEYNRQHPNEKMQQIIVVMDECHVLFSTTNSRKTQNEINIIVKKIATEGRSQGVHLLMATQTLANTEIPIEILNNISDVYLFKCAQSDSHRLAEGSDRFTKNLSVGQVYYKHVDDEQVFRTIYTPRQEQVKRIKRAIEKAAGCKANRQFCYNGNPNSILVPAIIPNLHSNTSIIGCVGRGITLDQPIIKVALKQDYSENVLIFGVDEEGQTTQVSINLLASMMFAQKQSFKKKQFIVFDCINDDSLPYYIQLTSLENSGLCKIVNGRERGKVLLELAQSIKTGASQPTILLILGQEKFRELRNDMPIESGTSVLSDSKGAGDIFGMSFKASSADEFSSYAKVLPYIIDNGPESDIHVILQLDKPSKLLFEDYQSPKTIYRQFAHILMLHCDDSTAKTLVQDDIHVDELSTDKRRLRAIYYNDQSNKYTPFTPFPLLNTTNFLK